MKVVQFTIDEALLKRVDSNPEVKARGRSAFLRRAIEEQLKRERAESVRAAYRAGYRQKPVRKGEFEVSGEALVWQEE